MREHIYHGPRSIICDGSLVGNLLDNQDSEHATKSYPKTQINKPYGHRLYPQIILLLKEFNFQIDKKLNQEKAEELFYKILKSLKDKIYGCEILDDDLENLISLRAKKEASILQKNYKNINQAGSKKVTIDGVPVFDMTNLVHAKLEKCLLEEAINSFLRNNNISIDIDGNKQIPLIIDDIKSILLKVFKLRFPSNDDLEIYELVNNELLVLRNTLIITKKINNSITELNFIILRIIKKIWKNNDFVSLLDISRVSITNIIIHDYEIADPTPSEKLFPTKDMILDLNIQQLGDEIDILNYGTPEGEKKFLSLSELRKFVDLNKTKHLLGEISGSEYFENIQNALFSFKEYSKRILVKLYLNPKENTEFKLSSEVLPLHFRELFTKKRWPSIFTDIQRRKIDFNLNPNTINDFIALMIIMISEYGNRNFNALETVFFKYNNSKRLTIESILGNLSGKTFNKIGSTGNGFRFSNIIVINNLKLFTNNFSNLPLHLIYTIEEKILFLKTLNISNSAFKYSKGYWIVNCVKILSSKNSLINDILYICESIGLVPYQRGNEILFKGYNNVKILFNLGIISGKNIKEYIDDLKDSRISKTHELVRKIYELEADGELSNSVLRQKLKEDYDIDIVKKRIVEIKQGHLYKTFVTLKQIVNSEEYLLRSEVSHLLRTGNFYNMDFLTLIEKCEESLETFQKNESTLKMFLGELNSTNIGICEPNLGLKLIGLRNEIRGIYLRHGIEIPLSTLEFEDFTSNLPNHTTSLSN